MSDCKIKYGLLPTQSILSALIAACSVSVATDSEMIGVAQKLFVTAFDVIQDDDENENKVGLRVFSSLLLVYSKCGDYKSCMDLLLQMEQNNDWPNPNNFCFAPSLKAVSIYNVQNEKNQLSKERQWELIEQILDIQKRNKVSMDVVTFSILFHSCNGDRIKLMTLYEQMVNVEKIRPNMMSLQNIMLGGLDGFIQGIEGEGMDKYEKLE